MLKFITALLLLFFTTISVNAQEGLIKKINYSGNKKTKESFLNRIIKVKKGDQLDSLKIKTDIDRIKRLDGIAHAEFTVESSGNEYIITYLLTENFSIIPGLRIGQANDDSFSFRASIFEFNGLGKNIIAGGFYQREVFGSFGAFIEHPYLFTNKLGLGLNYQDLTTQQPIYFPDNQVNYTHTRKGPEVTLFYEYNFNNRFELGVKIFKEQYLVIDGDPENEGIVNALEPERNKQLIRGSHEYVNLDLEYHNLSGIRNFFDASFFIGGGDLLQTEYIFVNNTQYFKRVGKKGNWANQLQLQYSNPVEDTFFVPIIIDNQLNTRGAGNTIARGVSSVALNTEYRHTFIEKEWFVLQGNTFLDVSGIQNPEQNLSDIFSGDNLRINPGIGFRLIHKRIFNAVLRFDYGFDIAGSGSNGFVFGIGQFF